MSGMLPSEKAQRKKGVWAAMKRQADLWAAAGMWSFVVISLVISLLALMLSSGNCGNNNNTTNNLLSGMMALPQAGAYGTFSLALQGDQKSVSVLSGEENTVTVQLAPSAPSLHVSRVETRFLRIEEPGVYSVCHEVTGNLVSPDDIQGDSRDFREHTLIESCVESVSDGSLVPGSMVMSDRSGREHYHHNQTFIVHVPKAGHMIKLCVCATNNTVDDGSEDIELFQMSRAVVTLNRVAEMPQ